MQRGLEMPLVGSRGIPPTLLDPNQRFSGMGGVYFALEADFARPISHENRVKMDPSRKVSKMTQIYPRNAPWAQVRWFGLENPIPGLPPNSKMPWRPILQGRFLTKMG